MKNVHIFSTPFLHLTFFFEFKERQFSFTLLFACGCAFSLDIDNLGKECSVNNTLALIELRCPWTGVRKLQVADSWTSPTSSFMPSTFIPDRTFIHHEIESSGINVRIELSNSDWIVEAVCSQVQGYLRMEIIRLLELTPRTLDKYSFHENVNLEDIWRQYYWC